MIMKCNKVSEKLIEYLQGELSQDEAGQIKSHLAMCKNCSDEADLLRDAFGNMKKLPIFPVSIDFNAMRNEAEKRQGKSKYSIWWKIVPAAACIAVIVVFSMYMKNQKSAPQIAVRFGQSSQSQIPVDINPPRNQNNTEKNHIKVKPAVTPQNVIQHTAASNTHPRQRTVSRRHRHNASANTNIAKVNIQKKNIPSWDESTAKIDAKAMIAKYVDVIAMSMVQSNNPRTSITCSIMPITSADEKDLPVADTMTAALICSLKDRYATIDVNRMMPQQDAGFNTPKADTLSTARIVDKVADDYVITGSIEKSKSGYLLSLYAYNKHDESIVFNGEHPILLPADAMPAISKNITPGAIHRIAFFAFDEKQNKS